MARNTKSLSKRAKKWKSETDKEAKLQEASDAVTDGTFKNLAIAARHFNVPYDTLRRRHHKLAAPRTKSQVNRQLLSEAQELALCEWIKYMGRIGLGIARGNPGVFQGYPYPYPDIPVPATGVWVSTGQGMGSHNFGGFENPLWVFEPVANLQVNKWGREQGHSLERTHDPLKER
ncbi:hypothetical protein EDB84DRAFT_1556845 [Lactarius hengduanensis]|nr:hypothetical protein EDB84DRAFT_1556845 [Lactarius hengduanensis]